MKFIYTTVLAFLLAFSQVSFAQFHWVNTFESFPLTKSDTFWNGQDETGGFTLNGVFYENSYNPEYGSWTGFSVSNVKDSATVGYGNQYAVFNDGGVNFTDNYVVANGSPKIYFDKPTKITGTYVCNATYTALSMKYGDQFAKKFGGENGEDPDSLVLKVYGWSNGNEDVVEVYLADFRAEDAQDDYILDEWTWLDFESFGAMDSMQFTLESSDNASWGMNTPAYFCLDNFNGIKGEYLFGGLFSDKFKTELDAAFGGKEYLNGDSLQGGFGFSEEHNTLFLANEFNEQWGSWTGFSLSKVRDTTDGTYANQYAAATYTQHEEYYVVGYKKATIFFPQHEFEMGFDFQFQFTNSYYAYHAMKHGSQFNKKFGGESGNDPDYLVLKYQFTNVDGEKSDTFEEYLADFRFEDNSKDYILKEWTYSEKLRPSNTSRIDFWIEGSDTGEYGLNTPAYFCFKEIRAWYMDVEDFAIEPFNVYPNPTRNILHLDEGLEYEEIKIMNAKGQFMDVVVSSENIIDVSTFPSGIYILQAKTTKGMATTKWIKL